ncbi:hemagglutinin repeat-containing protein, partial [Xenorhabdus mauleonii]
MNKQCYSLIYSRTHGELRVVSELARSCSTAPGQRRGTGGSRLWVTVRRAVWLLGAALFAGQALADGIIADRQAASAQRPEVITTQNGLPQVNINAPNQAGISHNPYQQFDVDKRGAILNNSAVMTSTQLAGMIQGNPRLDPNKAPARFIINEVNSDKPSQLQGFLEVAGGRAQVIVANPSGIVCNGCGTINAGRMTLTTGKPQLNADGSLAGYQVERGMVSIEGGGLNGDPRHDTGYVDILARAVKVNAGIWAKEELAVVAGRNHISSDGKTVTPLSPDSKAPELAIDMGQMGGMYSGHIRMIGTEAGVGVRNKGGHLQAGKTLTVSSEGKLSWQSNTQQAVTQAGGNINIAARDDIEHHGKLHSGEQLTIQSRQGSVKQSGTLAAAGDIQLTSARDIQSSGHLLAGSDINSTLTHEANLTLTSQGNIQASGSLLSKRDVNLTGQRVDISQSRLASDRAVITAQAGGVGLRQTKVDSRHFAVKTKGNIEALQAEVRAGRWNIDGNNLFNKKSVWSQVDAGESRFALTGALDNTEGTIEAKQLSFNVGSLNNQQGQLVALDNTEQHWQVKEQLNNTDGTVGSNGSLQLDVGRLNNQHGTLKSQSDLHVESRGDIKNSSEGKLLSGKTLTLKASGSVDNQSGEIKGEHLAMTAQRLNNTKGKAISKGRLMLDSQQQVDNQYGLLEAGDALDIRTKGKLDNRSGIAQGGKQIDIFARHIDNSAGKVLAEHTLTVNAGDSINNQRGTLQSQSALHVTSGADIQNGQGKLLAVKELTLKAGGKVDNQSGNIQGEHLQLTAQSLNNTKGKAVSKGRLQLDSRQQVDNQHGLIQTDDVLDISTDGKWDNRSGTTQGGKQVKISASHIDNSDGKLSAGQLLTLHASDSIENRSGDIQGENLQLTAPRLDNTKGKIVSKGHLLLDNHQAIDNQFGLLEAGGALDIRTKGKLDNRSGIAQGGKQVDISVHHIDNSVGKVLAEHTLTVNAGDSINNQRGTLQSQSALHVTSGADLQNGQGKLLAVKELTLKAGGKADNQSGNIQGEHLQLTVQSLNNTKGKAVSKGRLQLDSRQQVDNQHGLIQTDDVLDISTDGKWDNRSGTTQGGKQVKISASHIDNSDGKLSAGQLLTLHASDSIENRSGDIQGESLQLTAPRLDNTKGKIVSKGHLLLDNHQAIDNQHGLLEAGDALDIRTKGKLDNRSGIAQGGKQVDISAHHIDNSDGQVLAEHALTVNAGDSINNQRGTLQSQSALHVTLGADIQNGQGKLLAVKELTLKAGGKVDNQSGDIQGENLKMTAQNLNNTKGNIVSTGHFELDMEKGIENQNGLIEAANTLDIRTRSNWDNHNGIAQGGKKVIVSAHHLDNTAGKLQSGGDLTLKSLGKVINQSGTLTAKKGLSWQGEADSSLNNDAGWLFSEGVMSLKGGQLTNRQKGEILGKQGLTLDLTGSWDNQSGKIASNGHTKISALELLNSQGEIQVLNSLDMQFTQALNNNKGHIFSKLAQSLRAKNILNSQGWIGSQSSWSASGEQFDNSKGSVLSLHDATLTVSTLDNQKGTLQSAKALKLSVTQDIDNQAGKISAQGRLDVHGTTEDIAAGKLNNAGGQLLTGGDLIVKAKSLNNTSGGLIDSQKKIQLTLSEALDNHKGKLRSSEGMQLNAQSLANKMGSIDSKQQLGLSIVGLLNNIQGTVRSNGDQSISAGQINNQKGVFSSQGKLDLTTVQFDNPEGTVISQGNGSYRINELNNKKGKIHSGGTLTFNGKQIHNQAGELISTGDMWLDSTQLNNNEKGKITSQNALVVQSDQLNNSQGGLLLGTTRTEVTASKLDNTQGRLQSAGTLTLSNLTRLNNQQGYILANKSLDINTGTSSMLALLNQRGLVQSGNQLTANTLSMNNEGGTLLSQKGLTLTVQQDYTHRVGDTLSSNGALIFSVGGKLTNEADWLLPGNLTVNSTHFTNVGTLVGKVLKLTTGTLLNQNRLEADSMTLTSDKLDNTNTIMSDGITVRSRLIDNHGKDAVIAATERMDLHAGEHLINRDGSLIYSAGNLYLSSDDLIENRASRIEADGDGWVTAKRLNNLREGLKIEREAEKNDIKWHGYNYYWRSYGGGMNFDPTTIAPTTQRLTFNDDTAVENNIYGTLSDIDAANKRAQVRVKDNKGQLRKLWVNYLALTPSHDGSYDMTFYETRGHRQGMSFILMKIYPPTPYHNTIWREHNRGRIEQWDPKEHLDIANIPFVNDYNNFRERSSTGTVTRDKLVSEGIAAHILAGGKMVLNITDELLNDASTVSANGDLSVKGDGKITNKGYSVNERRQELLVDHYDQDARHWYPTHNTDETTALATIDAIISGNGNVTIGGAHLENTTVNQAQISVVEAAQKAAEAERVEWERNPLAVTVDDVTWQAKDAKLESLKELLTPLKRKLTSTDQSSISDDQLLTLLKRTLTSVDQPLISDDQLLSLFKRELTSVDKPLTPAELALTNKQRLDKVGTSVPNNGLFRQHPAEGSPYLVVTDERFTSRTRFISSDYLLQQVKYDPAQVHKRLGDGFYEQRLVREQMLKLTGRPSVRGEDAMAQYQALMNNGASVAQDFHLVPGVALTPAQIAALQQDIVWLVSETVDTATGPQTVWVPKVYLANTTLRLTGDGALIAGGNLQLSANSLNNSGNLFADRALNIDASQFLHQSGEIRADSIDVQADSLKMSTNLQDALRQASMSARELSLKGGDIQLQGAKLNAKQNLNLHARNNLDITAAKSSKTGSFEVISGAMGNRTSDGIEEAGKRMAQVSGEWQQALGSTLNAGGNLNLTAGQDITLKGSQVKAEGSARLQAGGNVNLLAETTTNNTHLEANSNTSSVSNSREEERLHLSTLSGGKGVAIQAGKNLTAEGAQVDSQYGSIGLSAQSVTIKDARQRVADQDSESKREGSKKSQREMETVSNNVVGSTFSGRDGISITASEGDITVTGSTLHSEQGELTLQAKKDITLNSATESDYLFSESRSEKRGFLSTSKTHTVQKDHVTREKGTLLSGDSISITAGNDLAVSGSAIVGDKDVTLQAGNNVDITAATETQTHYLLEEQKKSGLLSSGGIGFTVGSKSTRHEVNENGTTQSQSVSTVGSNQGDVSITAGNQVHVSGADLVASKDLSITGDSVQIDPGYDKRTREETFESKQSGLTLALSGSVGSALNTAVSTAQQARKESDGRLKALKGTQAALSGAQSYQAYQLSEANSAKADAINQAGGDAKKPDDVIGIQLSYGSQASKSDTRVDTTDSQGSNLNAGRDIRIIATGDKAEKNSGNIHIQGSGLKAGHDVALDAKQDIVLESAENTQTTRGKNSSQGGSVGVGL